MKHTYQHYREEADRIVRTYGAKTAVACLTDGGEKLCFSFSDIRQAALEVKAQLEACGVGPGDRAAILTPHSPYGVMAGLALAYLNVTAVLLDASLPMAEIGRLLAFSDVRALFTTRELFGGLPSELTGDIPCFALGERGPVPQLLPESSPKVRRPETADPETDVIAIIFSSGTTDQMKGVKVTYHSVLRARDIFAELSGLRDDMSYLLVLPFNHIAGFTGAMTYFLTGCEFDFIERADPAKLGQGLRFFQPHYFAMVPKVYEIIEEKIRAEIRAKGKAAERLILSLLRFSGFLRRHFGLRAGRRLFRPIVAGAFGENIYGIGTGASPCKDATTEFFLDLGLEWANLYAATETGVPIVSTGIRDRYPVGTVGNVNRHQGIDVKIHHPDGEGIGEIIVKTDLIMKGYFRRPDLTEAAFTGGYFKTGDYGYIDRKGYLHITGRIKEAILLQTGKKVSPSDIDAYYGKCCGQVRIASCGVSGPDGFDTVHLFIETHGQSGERVAEARRRIQEQSSAAGSVYQIAAIHEIDRLPLTSIGKVKRYVLKELAGAEEAPHTPAAAPADAAASVFEVICGLIASITGTAAAISPNSRLQEDIGMDSLGIFELCVSIDERFGVSLESYLHEGITAGELEALIGQRDREDEREELCYSQYPQAKTKRDLAAYRAFMAVSKKLWNFQVRGRENLISGETYIFCPNHESHLDGMWIIGVLDDEIRREICSMAADYLFDKRLSRPGLVIMGGIPVHRSSNTAPAMRRAYECLTSGQHCLLVHPEGTRSRSGQLGEFKPGAAKLSLETGVKIIPVCISGAYEIFPPHRKLPRLFDWRHFRRYPLQICFGTPISPAGKTAEEITEEIKGRIMEMKQERTV